MPAWIAVKSLHSNQCPILPNDTAVTLHQRIQLAERELFPAVIGKLAAKLTAPNN
jgi:folate-dependent phosphoribosylglycinamide formyltransferase PurN